MLQKILQLLLPVMRQLQLRLMQLQLLRKQRLLSKLMNQQRLFKQLMMMLQKHPLLNPPQMQLKQLQQHQQKVMQHLQRLQRQQHHQNHLVIIVDVVAAEVVEEAAVADEDVDAECNFSSLSRKNRSNEAGGMILQPTQNPNVGASWVMRP